jgi:glyoxylase-like metal-dependent hydrolase (beta-lactamase superfamily II)
MAGHTPGHTVFILESENEKLIFWGDLIHIPDVQFHGPDIENNFDFDKEKAAKQRQVTYEQAAAEGYLVAADHISFPGVGRVKKEGTWYRWLPMPYSLLKRTR